MQRLLARRPRRRGHSPTTRSSWPSTTARAPRSRTPPEAYAAAVAEGREKLADASWDAFARYLYTAGMPDPDLVIRTSGETRMSNFLLMQAAYAELYFSPVLWPDFSKADLAAAIADYRRRERRYGMTSEQLKPVAAAK